MAKPKKPDAEKSAKAKDEENEVTEIHLPTKEDVTKVVKKINTLKAKGATIQGDIGTLIQQAEDKMNIHRAAAKKTAAYVRMDQVKREEELAHLLKYLEYEGILPLGKNLLSGEGDGKVVPIRQQQAAE